MTETSDDLAAQLTLSAAETLTLHALCLHMMRNDIDHERRDKAVARKQAILDQFHLSCQQSGAEMVSEPHSDLLASATAEHRAKQIDTRSRAMIVLIELLTFTPWPSPDHWVSDVRRQSLKNAADWLGGIAQDDLNAATREYVAVMRERRRRSIRWGRVAAVSVLGLGVGVVTAGAAAPLIGGAIGATLGLSGAAATSAGLAMLGGGSLAAGGFGVFGGTILLTGVGGVFGAGAAGAATRFTKFAAADVVADAIKLALLSRLVLANAEDRDQKLRRVAEGLQNRINDFSTKINQLTERIATLTADVKRLDTENQALKVELASLKQERVDAEAAKVTLEVVRDRLPVPAV